MACNRPLRAKRTAVGGRITFCDAHVGQGADLELRLACGQCWGCRLKNRRDWAIRLKHESEISERSSFVTLTYDQENIPWDHGLRKRDLQLFLKRLRKHFPNGAIRYLAAGEYGSKTLRPHYHLIICGADFVDSSIQVGERKGRAIFVSALLADTWSKGKHEVEPCVTFEAASYAASYCTKKLTGYQGDFERLREVVGDYGEVVTTYVEPEFSLTSLKPGLGKPWFDQYWKDVYPDNFVVMNNRKFSPPRYYDELLGRDNPELLAEMKQQRKDQILKREGDYSEERLTTRERIFELQMKANLERETI